IEPSIKYKTSYLDALREGFHPRSSRNTYTENEVSEIEGDFSLYLSQITSTSETEIQVDGQRYKTVPQKTFWLVKDHNFIGCVHIRYELNDFWIQYGGHIGFYTRPSERHKGYATSALKWAINQLKATDVKRILLTTGHGNTGSEKIILRSGGALENIVKYNWLPIKIYRYWIDLP
ncbi:MAG: GNAT family N-acetyltransferase, partial [Gammaproteobacteria bacterium]|nr:GNAT family N-acetyltransferase [Gammaproteobacteria bacterium]